MENGPFEDVSPIKNGGFHCYVSLPEGTSFIIYILAAVRHVCSTLVAQEDEEVIENTLGDYYRQEDNFHGVSIVTALKERGPTWYEGVLDETSPPEVKEQELREEAKKSYTAAFEACAMALKGSQE